MMTAMDHEATCNAECEFKRRIRNPQSAFESGMTLLAVMAIMTFCHRVCWPSHRQFSRRSNAKKNSRRSAAAKRSPKPYGNMSSFIGGAKLPNSMDDLLEGLPQGTKKRQILRVPRPPSTR